MDKYRRVAERKSEEEAGENELRVNTAGRPRAQVQFALKLLNEDGQDSVSIKALGRAISKAITVAEVIKRRVPGLHQIVEVGSVEIVDVYEPLEEGLDVVEVPRYVSCIRITLSRAPLDTTHVGYQPPLPEEEVSADEPIPELGSGRGRGRGGRGGGGGGGGGRRRGGGGGGGRGRGGRRRGRGGRGGGNRGGGGGGGEGGDGAGEA